jgi:hypothetical protein
LLKFVSVLYEFKTLSWAFDQRSMGLGIMGIIYYIPLLGKLGFTFMFFANHLLTQVPTNKQSVQKQPYVSTLWRVFACLFVSTVYLFVQKFVIQVFGKLHYCFKNNIQMES